MHSWRLQHGHEIKSNGKKKLVTAEDTVKKPLSSYMFFVQDHRDEVTLRHPNARFVDVSDVSEQVVPDLHCVVRVGRQDSR